MYQPETDSLSDLDLALDGLAHTAYLIITADPEIISRRHIQINENQVHSMCHFVKGGQIASSMTDDS